MTRVFSVTATNWTMSLLYFYISISSSIEMRSKTMRVNTLDQPFATAMKNALQKVVAHNVSLLLDNLFPPFYYNYILV